MHVVSDSLLPPATSPAPGVARADPAPATGPDAFERELREVFETREETRGTSERPASRDPDPRGEDAPQAEADRSTPPGEEVVSSAAVATVVDPPPPPDLPRETAVATEGIAAADETTRAREGIRSAPEGGAAPGDTPLSSPWLDDEAGDADVPETTAKPEERLLTAASTRPEISAEARSGPSPETSPLPIEPSAVALAGVTPPPGILEAPAAPEAPRSVALPSGAPPPMTYEAIAAPVRVLAREGGGEARIHLAPPELGRVEITVVVEDGQVRATLAPERADVAALLQKHVSDLEERLADLGLDIEDVTVRTDGSRDEGPDGRRDQAGASGDGVPLDAPLSESNETEVHIGPDGVDVWA